MERIPAVRYARTPDGIQLAYQVFGAGPRDLVLVWGGVSHIELFWDDPTLARIFRRLSSFARVIQFDRRGTGMSDRPSGPASLEARMQDIGAVMDAVGSDRAALLGESESGPLACVYAATHPDRTSALILYGPVIRMLGDPSFPWAPEPEVFAEALELTTAEWGSEDLIWGWAPTAGDDPRARQFFSRFMRMSSSPGAYRDQMWVNADIDVRRVLPHIAVPTLVLHRGGDSAIHVGQGRYAGRQIPGARYVELPGQDHLLIAGDPAPFLDEIEQFLTGVRSGLDVDRALATIVFTDIVASTELAARMGDGPWRRLLDEHDALLRRELLRFGGRQVNTMGDGMLASFEGPDGAVGWARSVVGGAPALGVQVRAGVHLGECELRGHDLAGLTVHVAARIGSLAAPGEVLVSAAVRDLAAGSGYALVDRGTHLLKGVPEPWAIYAVEAPPSSAGPHA